MILACTTLSLLLLASPITPSHASPAVTLVADAIPASLFKTEKPKDAKDLRETKAAAQKGEVKKGDSVTIRGRIGGRAAPFVKSRAIFLLADSRLVACNEKPGDTCKVPWDFCCETPESLKSNTATIQIVGSDGKPLKVAAEGAGGMKPLSKITVVGTVADVSKEGTFVITATAIHVE
jgi:hypothetical protein